MVERYRLRAIVRLQYIVWAAVGAECTREARLDVRVDVGVIFEWDNWAKSFGITRCNCDNKRFVPESFCH